MSLPLHVHAAALLAAITVTTVVVDVMAEIGHPGPEGAGVLALFKPTPQAAQSAFAGVVILAPAAQPMPSQAPRVVLEARR
jgi:hypothetical protein